jgi:hypothetical protein
LAKPNYRHAKKQKEAARKARQDAKHQRKNTPDTPDTDAAAPTEDGAVEGAGTDAAVTEAEPAPAGTTA